MPLASNTSHWRRVEDLFYAALDLDPAARSAFLDAACGQDLALRDELESLLASSQQSLDFARGAIVEVAHERSNGPLRTGMRVGAYRLLEVLGKGGMGTVYLAARADQLYEQHVAIKLMHAGFAPKQSMRLRFSAERQILANLNHPNIARLLDGGITEDGLPYLVMEYVDGIPIDMYCRQECPSLENLLNLFLATCAAVDYAHQNLVIHRDIKPGNILVTPEGVPKLLDFGISKLLHTEERNSDPAMTTEWLMTPEYASPEQVSGTTVTTATDVYALGVLLYELLCGKRPFHVDSGNPREIIKAIREQIPEPPSKLIRATSQFAERRGYREYHEDLNSIVLMAMRKEPEHRYASVAEFANDLRRCLDDYPVRARAGNWMYDANKFIRRHKVGTVVATFSIAALIGFSIAMGVLAKRATQARLVAEQQRLSAQKEAEFLASIFQAATPDEAKGKQITARELLDTGVMRIDKELANVPETQATMLDDVGHAYTSIGLYDQAKPLMERAYKMRTLSGQTLDLATTADGLARIYRLGGNYEKAEPLFRQALAIRKKLAGADNHLVAESMSNLGECLYWEGHDVEAEQLLEQALAIERKADPDLEAAATRNYLALELERKGNYDEASQLLQQAVDIAKGTQGDMSPAYAIFLQNLGGAQIDSGNLEAAEGTERRALEVRRRLTGDDHPDIAYTLNLLGWILLAKGEWVRAEPFLKEALTVRQKLLGEHNPLYARSLENWARVTQAKGDYASARKMFQRALQILQEAGGSDSWTSAQTLSNLGLLELDQGNYVDAERNARQALEIRRKLRGEDSPDVATSLLEVGLTREFQDDLAGAEQLFREALDIRQKELRPGHPSMIAAEVRLGELLTEEDHLDLAAPLLSEAHESAHHSPFPLLPWQVAEVDNAIGAYLIKRGNVSQGLALLRSSVAAMKGYPETAMRERVLQRTTHLERLAERESMGRRELTLQPLMGKKDRFAIPTSVPHPMPSRVLRLAKA